MNSTDKISLKQLFCLVILTQVGVHILAIPYDESRHSGHDAWMAVLLGGVYAQLGILIIYFLGKRFGQRTLPQYISIIVGKPLGAFINLLFCLYCAESCLAVMVGYIDVLSRWMLYSTPWWVITGVMFAVTAYIATSSLQSISTITETLMLVFLACFLIVFISGTGKGDMLHFMPILNHKLRSIVIDSLPSFWAYAGYELLLYVFPYVKCRKKKHILLTVSAANGFTTFFYVLITVIVTYSFSENQLNSVFEPMIFILRQFAWPVVQSLDLLFLALWLLVTLATVYVYLFLSARYLAFAGTKEIPQHSLIVWGIAALCFGLGQLGSNRQWLLDFSAYHKNVSIVVILFFPTILLLVSILRRKADLR
ncbi:GerAB/ArcD/ProY family transporter [Paenibacillus sp. NFR01]|uniref:GerAB/ArcD/ProY family transporter n=1 Tax=Paenibacillus sp. NFR01 TaxID=1566279 RepID=UPI0008B35844|nr:GerAB/ArcD/ProY family transporter [Paenibacillus sp. NFR01]SET07140.1 spore germination protein (amino acid permease) [Paenibacillus sp. NFR01]